VAEMNLAPVKGPATWNPDDFDRDNTWIYHLSTTDLIEIEQAKDYAFQCGLARGPLTPHDFPLSMLGPRLHQAMQEIASGRGFVLFRGLPVDQYTLDEMELIYCGLSCHMGEVTPQNMKGDLIFHVMDGGYEYGAPNVKASETNHEHQPHTDPAGIVGLLCMRPAHQGGVSMISSAATIFNAIKAERPADLEILCRGFHYDLRSDGVSASGAPVSDRIPVFFWHHGQFSCRFNSIRIKLAADKTGIPLTREEIAAIEFMESVAKRPDVRLRMTFQPGDIQYLNNFAILHSRTAFSDVAEEDRKRLLLRLWLNTPASETMTVFAERLNTEPTSPLI
jgi:hypothetical protein